MKLDLYLSKITAVLAFVAIIVGPVFGFILLDIPINEATNMGYNKPYGYLGDSIAIDGIIFTIFAGLGLIMVIVGIILKQRKGEELYFKSMVCAGILFFISCVSFSILRYKDEYYKIFPSTFYLIYLCSIICIVIAINHKVENTRITATLTTLALIITVMLFVPVFNDPATIDLNLQIYYLIKNLTNIDILLLMYVITCLLGIAATTFSVVAGILQKQKYFVIGVTSSGILILLATLFAAISCDFDIDLVKTGFYLLLFCGIANIGIGIEATKSII